jgi:Ni,Fe-hydrogenase III small subunit
VGEIIPVDVFIPGCPPSPLTLIHGLLLAVGRAEQRLQGRTIPVRNDLLMPPLARHPVGKEEY